MDTFFALSLSKFGSGQFTRILQAYLTGTEASEATM